MTVRSLIALAALLLAACGDEAGDGFTPGEIETVQLDEAGQAEFQFETGRAGLASFDLFSASEKIGTVSAAIYPAGEGADAPIDTRLNALAPGRYRLVIESEAPGPAEIQARLRLDPPLDGFEPNDSPQTAARVDLPLRAVIQLSDGEQDWFEIRPEAGAVIGIRLVNAGGAYRGPMIEVRDSEGETLFQSANEDWGWGAMRYVEADGGPLLVGVWDTASFRAGDPRSLKGIEIVRYSAAPYPAGTFVTLGLGEDETAFNQLALAGRAAGLTVARTEEADSIAREFSGAIERDRPGPSWIWTSLAFLLAFAIGAGMGWVARTRLG